MSPRFPLLSLFVLLFTSLSFAEIRFAKIKSDDQTAPLIPLDDFGFTHTGHLELNVSNLHLSDSNPNLNGSKIGFFLTNRDSFVHALQQDNDDVASCILDSKFIKPALTFDKVRQNNLEYSAIYNINDADQLTLVFANCLTSVKVSMSVVSSMYNLDQDGKRDYLSAGKTVLPRLYFLFSLVYFSLAGFWVYVLYKKRSTIFKIHMFMLVVVVLKALNLICEAEDKSLIKRTGFAHGWDVLFYIFSFLKGITLFSLIVLIGTGWSFLKPYLQDKEKKVLMIVIPLQVVANFAQIFVDEDSPYDHEWITWRQIFLLVDVICCCAVLFPIIWSIKNLREAARTDGKAAVNLMKLTLFRQYYVVVICYIYFTRVVVYALENITSYRYFWTSILAGELATLAFYVYTGYKFKPEAHNPYLAIDDEEEEAAAEAIKLDDEFDL